MATRTLAEVTKRVSRQIEQDEAWFRGWVIGITPQTVFTDLSEQAVERNTRLAFYWSVNQFITGMVDKGHTESIILESLMNWCDRDIESWTRHPAFSTSPMSNLKQQYLLKHTADFRLQILLGGF